MCKKRWIWPLLVVILSFFSFKSLLRLGYFPMHDDMQAMRVLQMDKCIKDGQIPCRWVPDMGYGYGYPQFNFYSPLPYYVMELFHLIGFSVLDSVKIGFILSFLLSGVAMFLLGKTLWGDLGGLISSLFYVYIPYRASDVFTRGAVGEFWAMVFLPLIFWAIVNFIKGQKLRDLSFFAFFYGCLLLTHNITSLIFTPVAASWSIFLLWYFDKWNCWRKILAGFIWGVGWAAFFILPAIFEKKFVHVETMLSGYFNYLAHFVSIGQLFIYSRWGYGSSELGPYDDLSFFIGQWYWLVGLITVLVAFLNRKKQQVAKIVFFLSAVTLFALFLTHQRSSFIWENLKILHYLQFPWRFLTIVSFSICLPAGYLIFGLKDQGKRNVLGVFLIAGVIFFNAFYFRPQFWYPITDKDKFSGELWEKQLTISIFDYLPIFARMPPSRIAPDYPLATEGKLKTLFYEKGTSWQKGEIEVESLGAKVQLPLFYFPGFRVQVDGKEVIVNYDNYYGLISFTVPAGKHFVEVKLHRTPIRVIGEAMTICSFGILIFFLSNERLAKKRS